MINYNTLLKQYDELPGHEIETNYFEVTGYSHYENIASNVLKFYLDPAQSHGMEDLVLRSLLEISDKDFLIGGFNNVNIDREVTTSKSNRIDIVIETDEYLIAIENKIRHFLNNNLLDYEEHLRELNNKNEGNKKLLFLVLSLKNIKSKKEKDILNNSVFENITYSKLINQIKKNYNKYLFTANTKFMIFLNEFILSLEKQIGNNMKEEQLTKFYLDNVNTLEELTKNYISFKSKILRQKIEELKAAIDGKYENISKNWIYQNSTLVQDFKFYNYKIAVDTIINIKSYKITVFGRNNDSHEFLRTDKFYELTNIQKKLKPLTNERLVYKTIEFTENTDSIFEQLDSLLNNLNHGVNKLEKISPNNL